VVGLNLDAVRLDETAAAVFGIDVARWKILAFTFGNFFAGIAGAAYAMMTGFVAPNSFTFGDSLILVSIVLLGGLGSAWACRLPRASCCWCRKAAGAAGIPLPPLRVLVIASCWSGPRA